MSGQRSLIEQQLLKMEAQRRMRAGDACAEIASGLGISQSTLGNWAAEGRWRKRDIVFERSDERGQALLAQIAETKIREYEETERRAARARELGESAMKAMQAADPDGDGTAPGMTALPTHQLSLAMAHDLLQQGRLDDADRAARFAMRFAQAQKATNDRDSLQWRADRERILDWWQKHRDGFNAFHKYASESIDELKSMVRYERRAWEAGMCPTCSRPADFWPAEMDKVADAMVERMEDSELAEKTQEARYGQDMRGEKRE